MAKPVFAAATPAEAPAAPPAVTEAPPVPSGSSSPVAPAVPMMFVTSVVDGYAPVAGVLVTKGRHAYTQDAAAALVNCGLGTVSPADLATLEAACLLTNRT